jgi:hypothetical protein
MAAAFRSILAPIAADVNDYGGKRARPSRGSQVDLLRRNSGLRADEIRREMSGKLTGYGTRRVTELR